MKISLLVLIPLALFMAGCDQVEAPVDAQPAPSLSQSAAELAPIAATSEAAELYSGPFAPRDECADDPTAAIFVRQLKSAVAARDSDALLRLTEPTVELDFGGGIGVDELRTRLASKDYDLWAELDEIMLLGCSVKEMRGELLLTMPWVFAQETKYDPFESLVVMGENVPVRARPSNEAPVVARVSWDEVELAYGDDPTPRDADGQYWTDVWLREIEGQKRSGGFIRSDQLRSIIDYRIGAILADEGWKITFFIAGD